MFRHEGRATAEQFMELQRELAPRRRENPGVSDEALMEPVPGKRIVFAWRRRHGRLDDPQDEPWT